jgi:hypothetical protein
LSAHHSPPSGALGLYVLATDGDRVKRWVFAEADTGCQHTPDGHLYSPRGRPAAQRLATTSFRAGTWVVAAWVLGVEADGRLQLQDVEWARPQPSGVAAATEAAVSTDTAWFAANPSATSYFRCALPGEWSTRRVGEQPAPDAVLMVEVRRLAPGLHTRKPTWALPLGAGNQSEPPQENE